jgi:hypothetical protein
MGRVSVVSSEYAILPTHFAPGERQAFCRRAPFLRASVGERLLTVNEKRERKESFNSLDIHPPARILCRH